MTLRQISRWGSPAGYGYNAVAALPGMERLACAVHTRRKFVEAKKASPHGKSPRADQAIEFFAPKFDTKWGFLAIFRFEVLINQWVARPDQKTM